MTDSPGLREARKFLASSGYTPASVEEEYRTWLGPGRGIATVDLLAFGRSSPKDMSTAVVSVGAQGVSRGYDVAQTLAAPYFIVTDGSGLSLWVNDPAGPRSWRSALTSRDAPELAEWLRPAAALQAKLGLRQLALFDVPVNLLARARSAATDQLAPILTDALAFANSSLPANRNVPPSSALRATHRRAARLVVGALTALVIRDQHRAQSLSASSLLDDVSTRYRGTFAWTTKVSTQERRVLIELISQLGEGIDYASLDPAILSHVYEQTLVDDDDRRNLGIHYTPPALASRLLAELPVEIVAPEDRHVLDPTCGSGTLLIAAHDRLRDLQPARWSDAARHLDLAVHLRGYDKDPFAVEIARLSLLLNAQPAGNGWSIDEIDTLKQLEVPQRPNILIANPPWGASTVDGGKVQAADAFLGWSMEALSPGGLLGVLLPGSWLTTQSSSGVRHRLSAEFEVFEVWQLPEGTFSTSQVSTAVVLARKRHPLGGRGARLVRKVGRQDLADFLAGNGGGTRYVQESSEPLEASIPPPRTTADVRRLDSIALVLSGQQPLPEIADREEGVPYLNHFRDVRAYGTVEESLLWRVDFPADFQSSRGERILRQRKVLVSAARSSNSPWRFRVALDPVGVAVRNSVRGIAPFDQSDDDLLYALYAIIGSTFASSYVAQFGGDRNIPAKGLKSLPVPTDEATIRRLSRLGQAALALASDSSPGLSEHLRNLDHDVWDAYGVSNTERLVAEQTFAGYVAPEGSIRYQRDRAPSHDTRSALRRVGVVLSIDALGLQLWVNGVTPSEGTRVALPRRMPGWLLREGATFDVRGVETPADLESAIFSFQPMSWKDIDISNDVPFAAIDR